MPKITYIGPHDAVTVPTGDGTFVDVERNHSVEVDAAAAADLVAGGDWRPFAAKTKRKAATAQKRAARTVEAVKAEATEAAASDTTADPAADTEETDR